MRSVEFRVARRISPVLLVTGDNVDHDPKVVAHCSLQRQAHQQKLT